MEDVPTNDGSEAVAALVAILAAIAQQRAIQSAAKKNRR